MDPYRAAVVRPVEKLVRLPEERRPPRRSLRAIAFTDGTTRIRVRQHTDAVTWTLLSFAGLAFATVIAALFDAPSRETLGAVILLSIPGYAWLRRVARGLFAGERLFISRAAVGWKRGLRRAEIFPLDQVSTVVLSGADGRERIDLQIGRQRVEICAGLGHHGDDARWIVHRLRAALDHARHVR